MRIFDGIGRTIGLAMAGKGNPWGKPAGSGGDGEPPSGDDSDNAGDGEVGESKPRGPRNPWLPGGGEPRRSANIEDIFRNRGPEEPRRKKFGGPGGPGFRFPERPGGKSWFPLAIGAIFLVWIGVTSIHFVQPREQGVVTWLGAKYSKTLNPGTNFTFPWPIQAVDVANVSQIRSEKIPEGNQEKLILTSDQNLVDLSYLIRWNISDLALYKFQLQDPRDGLLEVGESAMRAAVGRQKLDTVLTGAGRAEIEQDVRARMQARLDAYRSGIIVQGIEINKTDPPSRVEEAFKDVSSAQQDADAATNRARAIAQQMLARAQGDASEFNNIYAEYRLAPEVTRRRLYYETMESVLSKTDKTIVEARGVTPYLPLPEIKRREREAEQQATQARGAQ